MEIFIYKVLDFIIHYTKLDFYNSFVQLKRKTTYFTFIIASSAVRVLATVAEVNNASAEDGTANGIIQLPSTPHPKPTQGRLPEGEV